MLNHDTNNTARNVTHAHSRLLEDRSPWLTAELAEEVVQSWPTEGGGKSDTNVDVPDAIGALEQWRKEVRRGQRKIYTLDALARAAIAEANATDELRDGQRNCARDSRLAAAKIIVEAVADRQERAS